MAINEQQRDLAEQAIKLNEKKFNYRTTQWQIDYISKIFGDGDGNFTDGELFVPTYQRDYVWSEDLKSKFIESLFLNIPIPYIFVSEDYESGGLEIVDGYQRIRTMYEFINNEFKLKKLEKLTELSGFRFSDFNIVRQKLFRRIVMNVVIFENLDIEQKKEMFARINTTSEKLNPTELRKGTIGGEFYLFMKTLSAEPLFKKLCPLSPDKLKREEDVELILRFFSYTEWFEKYNGHVDPFLTEYMRIKNIELKDGNKDEILKGMKESFMNMLNFVQENFTYGFRKKGTDKSISSRVYFEAISVGVGLSLMTGGDLNKSIINKLLKDKNFQEIVTSDGANATKKFKGRINAVFNALTLSNLPEKL